MILRLAICSILLAGATIARGQDFPTADPPPTASIVLLRNGQVLHGRLATTGDFCTVELHAGGTVRVPAGQVDFACRDLGEAYRLKLARTPQPTAQQRIELADWCLRHDLHSAAAEQILAARKEEPQNPRVAMLERKLLARLAESRAKSQQSEAAPVAEEIDDITPTAISPKAMEVFSNSVQPMLLNRCGTANCHGPATTSGFQLTRSPWGNSQPRRFTQKNLNAVLKLVDRDNAEASKIVKIPQQPHGSAKQPLFGDRDSATMRLLIGWIAQLNAKDNVPFESGRPAKIQRPGELSLHAAGAPSMWMPIAGDEGATSVPLPSLKPQDLGTNPVDPKAPQAAPGSLATPADGAKQPLKPPTAPPPDPFDPAAFNRLYHPAP